MKKLSILAIAIVCSVMNVIAAANHDLIIKTNSEKIEALIQEVSDTEVRYKKVNNPTGPVYIVKTADISTIIFANGEVQVMEQKAATQSQPQTQPQPQPQTRTQEVLAQMQATRTQTGQAAASSSLQAGFFLENQMRKDGNIYYLGKKPMRRNEMLEFMKKNCDQAYQQYLKNRKLERAGWALFGVGAVIAAGGGLMNYGVYQGRRATHPAYTQNTYEVLNNISFAVSGVGGALFVASIPMICVGAVRKNNVHKTYNIWCAEEDKTTSALFEFDITSDANGLGLAMSF